MKTISDCLDLEDKSQPQLSEWQKEELSKEWNSERIAEYWSTIEEYRQSADEFPTVMEFGERHTAVVYLKGEDNEYKYIEKLNGAVVKSGENAKLQCEFDRKGVSFQISNNTYLGDIFENAPYGIIKKNKTGVGATTLELNSRRNSIIVMPTKALAHSKAMCGKDADTGKRFYIYVGSKLKDDNDEFPSLEDYIADDTISYKKIVVVSDSLKKVIEAIGPDVFTTYFLMVDEIDIYQSDSVFRPALETVIDYYFCFKPHLRCLVSATIRDFSNPWINCEPTINIKYTESLSRDISLIHTNNPNAAIKEVIEGIVSNNSAEKIFIAYNKVKYIRQIIQYLREELREECSILCSEASKDHAGKYYIDKIEDDRLPKRINFATNPFFAGIDIKERYHLISVSNVELQYTLLSPDKLLQIAGRCRDTEGLLSETVIYSTSPYGRDVDAEEYRDYILEFSKDILEYINSASKLVEKYSSKELFGSLMDKAFLEVRDDIVKRTERYYYKDTKMSVVRKRSVPKGVRISQENEYSLAYFNIDSLYDSVRLHRELYASPDTLCETLKANNNIIGYQDKEIEYSDSQREIDSIIDQEYQKVEEESIEAIIEELKVKASQNNLDDREVDYMIRNTKRIQKKFLQRFKALYKYIPLNTLLDDLRDIGNLKEFRGYLYGAIFYALDENHPFKIIIKYNFPENTIMPTTEIKDKMNSIFEAFYLTGIMANKGVEILKLFIKAERGNTHKNRYKIISHNRNGYEAAPLMIIPASETIKDLLDYREKRS